MDVEAARRDTERRATGGSAVRMLKQTFTKATLRLDAYRAKLVFFLLLGSLSVFFAAALASYCIIRLNAFRQAERIPYVTLQIPPVFWLSTLCLLGISLSLHAAVKNVRRNRLIGLHRGLALAAALAAAFVVLQVVGLSELLEVHRAHADGRARSFGICFSLATLHGLHVLAGIAVLAWLGVRSRRLAYDHERHWPVDNLATYWHFLDGLWILMLVTFIVAR